MKSQSDNLLGITNITVLFLLSWAKIVSPRNNYFQVLPTFGGTLTLKSFEYGHGHGYDGGDDDNCCSIRDLYH